MTFFIHGTGEIPVIVDEVLVKCPACETDQWADLLLFSIYAHMYWLGVLLITGIIVAFIFTILSENK